MKTILMLLLSVSVYAQDSLYIKKVKDEMTDKVSYHVNKKATVFDASDTKGFSIIPYISDEYKVTELSTVSYFESCCEKDKMIILFEDDTKIELSAWNDFNCKGYGFFELSEKHKEYLSTKKVKKIRLTNGVSFKSFTGQINDSEYFIKIFNQVKNESR